MDRGRNIHPPIVHCHAVPLGWNMAGLWKQWTAMDDELGVRPQVAAEVGRQAAYEMPQDAVKSTFTKAVTVA